MLEREVRAAARAVLDDGCETDAPGPSCVGKLAELYGSRHTQLVSGVRDDDRRRFRERDRAHPLPIAVELVRGPLRRRREIELEVASARPGRNERFEARVLPEPLCTLREQAVRNRELRKIARQPIAEAHGRATLFELGASRDRERALRAAAAMRNEHVLRHDSLRAFMRCWRSSSERL